MNNSIKKFLEFNGKDILFLHIDGQYWVALKPICEALNVNWVRQFINLKENKILSQLFANQLMIGVDNRLRKMVALPEKYVYGWLFSINSESQALREYQMKCYELLFNYFHGTIGERCNVLSRKADYERELQRLDTELRDDQRYLKAMDLKGAILRTGKELKKLDEQFIQTQLSLFN